MSRPPRDPFSDINGPFGGFGPFGDDPFFRQFEQMHDRIFRDFFGNEDQDIPTIFIEHPGFGGNSNDQSSKPDLSAINPDAPSSGPPVKRQDSRSRIDRGVPSLFRMFEHFFEPEYDERKLSDINPALSDNGPIMNNEVDNKGLIHPDGTPPGFRSPYLPNRNGVEKSMEFSNNGDSPQRFFRSQSVVISTGPDGRTTKTTTIRDSNGQSTTTTQDLDDGQSGNGNGFGDDLPSLFQWGFGNSSNRNDIEDKGWNIDDNQDRLRIVPMLEQTNDPFAMFRKRWENWKWNPYNWYQGKEPLQNPRPQCDLGNRDDGRKREGVKWTPYREYRSDGKTKKPDLLDDIVKKD